MSENIIIRQATATDIATLLRFEQGVVTTERHFDPTLKPHPSYYYDIERMINDPLVELLVAEFDGHLIGCGYARIEKSKDYLKHQQHSYLGFMYVEPEWRGKDVNQMIIENLKRWSTSKGVTELRLDVYIDNLPAIRAYEKAGFKKLMVQMRMPVESRR